MAVDPFLRPFAHTPDPRRHVEVLSARAIFDELIDAVRCGDGLAVLTGPWGVGKSHTAIVAADVLKNGESAEEETGDEATDSSDERCETFTTVLLPSGGIATRRAMLQSILHDLGRAYAGLSEQENRLAVLDEARTRHAAGKPIVIILDEAERASDRLLEELRAMTNFVADGTPLFRVLLVGETALEDRLATGELDAVNQRIVCQTNLASLTAFESANYIAGRLELVGKSVDEVFEASAVEEICRVAVGLPRGINLLAERAIEIAAEEGVDVATTEHVEAALDVLEGLPVPWRRPLKFDDATWKPSRRTDEIAPLEPLGGAVFEVGGDGEATPEPPPRVDDLPSPLRRMQEMFAECDDDEGRNFSSIANEFGVTAKPSGDVEDDETAAGATDDEGTAEVDDADIDESVGDTSCDAVSLPGDDELAAISGAADLVDDPPEAEEQTDDVETEDAAEHETPVEEILAEFAEPLSTSFDDDDELVQDSSEGNDEPEYDIVDPFASGGKRGRRDRAASAEKLLDAMIPLIEQDTPDDADVEVLQALLSSPTVERSHAPADGNEDSLGGQALNLAAEVGAAVHVVEPAGDAASLDDPSFAFEATDVVEQDAVEPDAASDVEAVRFPVISEPEGTLSPEPVAKPTRETRRLEGLFTRLRRERNR